MGDFRKAVRFFVLSVGLLYIVVIALGILGFASNRQRAHEGQRANDKICNLANDYLVRIEAGQDFLKLNPQGIPGIKAETIRNSLKNQQQTLQFLAPGCGISKEDLDRALK